MIGIKRGYTLIEVIVVISIIMLLAGITVTLTVESISDYFINIERVFLEDKFDNALLNMDIICNSGEIVSIKVNEQFNDIKSNNIKVNYKDINGNLKIKIIYLKGENLMVRTLNYESGTLSVGDNIILNNVNSFEVIEKEKLIYYKINSLKYGERVRCLWEKDRE